MFIICLDYLLQTSTDLIKENDFTLKKTRSKRYSTEIMTDTDYADDLTLLIYTPSQAKSLQHSMEQIAGSMRVKGIHPISKT